MPRGTISTVLLIEPDIFLRRLIALGLTRREMQVIESNSLTTLAEQPIAVPDLLVLDIDNGYHDDSTLLSAVLAHPYLAELPMVVLAWDPAQFTRKSVRYPLLEWLAKPFDARKLHITIENLLETSAALDLAARRDLAPAASSVTAFSGLSPLLTAAGLLLTVIGLMMQLFVAGAGLLVVLIGLLWWTLGKHPQRQILLGELRPHYSPFLQ